MSDFYVKICTSGHVLVDSSPLLGAEFCENCGSKMLSSCPSCGSTIDEFDFGGVCFLGVPDYTRPSYCKHCGKPYPWTSAALESTSLMLQEDSELSELDRQKLEESLPDLISETPKTQLAVIRAKKALISASQFTADALRQFIIDFGCELVKSSLGF